MDIKCVFVLMTVCAFVRYSESLVCYGCSNISDVDDCNNTVECQQGQSCFLDSSVIGQTTKFSLGCTNNQNCGGSPNTAASLIGRDITARQSQGCHECCSIDNCNKQLCRHPEPSACIDDAKADCAWLSTVFNVCSDIHHAKTTCPKFCGLCNLGCQTGEMCIDLDQTGATIGSIPGVSVISGMTPLMGGKPCSRQTVLKVHFLKDLSLQESVLADKEYCPNETIFVKPPLQHMLKVQMYLSNGERSGWMFNIGDSQSNNGYGGDGGDQMFDAEIHGIQTTIQVYGHDNCNPPLMYNHVGALSYPVSVANFWIKNQYLKVSTDRDGLIQSTCDSCLFALQGQTDPEGKENEDIYIGANRVVAGGRTGVGLCYMKLSWVNGPWQ